MIKRVLTALAATLLPLGAHAADAITAARYSASRPTGRRLSCS
ncbi:hypothetical protein NX009_02210 [Klebsiella pneumoniae]|nr:hypothetical protein [Klebsiella pneumoniae]